MTPAEQKFVDAGKALEAEAGKWAFTSLLMGMLAQRILSEHINKAEYTCEGFDLKIKKTKFWKEGQ